MRTRRAARLSEYLCGGGLAALAPRRLPQDRADICLDPRNSPCWIRDGCDRRPGRRIIFVDSCGPNRVYESNEWEIGGDDAGAVIHVLGENR